MLRNSLYFLVAGILIISGCHHRDELDMYEEGVDPNFKPTTKQCIINLDSSKYLSTCFFENNDLQLTYASSIDSISWSKRNDLNQLVKRSSEPYIKIAEPGVFAVIASKYGVADTHYINVYSCAASIDVIPSAFSPNNDWNQDTWVPIGYGVKSITIEVYSIDNVLLFTSYSLSTGWDGTFDGKPVQSGTYKYVVKGTLETGKTFTYRGKFTLTR